MRAIYCIMLAMYLFFVAKKMKIVPMAGAFLLASFVSAAASLAVCLLGL